jgi:hypothetical protein
MESLFSPCTRYRAVLGSQCPYPELNLNVSADDFLSAERGFTYAGLYAMLGNREAVAWLTPHAFVDRGYQDMPCRFSFSADGKDIDVFASSHEHSLGICDVVLRLLAVSAVHSVTLRKWTSRDDTLINSPTLAYLMDQCQSLKVLKLQYLKSLNESHCLVLGNCSRPGLEIEMICCKLTTAGTCALVEVLGRNQGPTKLDRCGVDTFVLADGLRGNSRLKSLALRLFCSSREDDRRQVLAIAGALKENKGLIDLNLNNSYYLSYETWDAVCDSLKTHPTLEVLSLRSRRFYRDTSLDFADLKSRMQALSNMMKMNTSIHTIQLSEDYSEHFIYRESVIPYLETNRFRPRLLAIQRTRQIAYRAKVLGRALHAVRTDANSFWMLLSGNAEVAFPSRATTVAAAAATAASLHTPATAVATSTSTKMILLSPIL